MNIKLTNITNPRSTKISVVKEIRRFTGKGLKESKDIADALMGLYDAETQRYLGGEPVMVFCLDYPDKNIIEFDKTLYQVACEQAALSYFNRGGTPSGGFMNKLFDLLVVADANNAAKLSTVFPEEAHAFFAAREGDTFENVA